MGALGKVTNITHDALQRLSAFVSIAEGDGPIRGALRILGSPGLSESISGVSTVFPRGDRRKMLYGFKWRIVCLRAEDFKVIIIFQ